MAAVDPWIDKCFELVTAIIGTLRGSVSGFTVEDYQIMYKRDAIIDRDVVAICTLILMLRTGPDNDYIYTELSQNEDHNFSIYVHLREEDVENWGKLNDRLQDIYDEVKRSV